MSSDRIAPVVHGMSGNEANASFALFIRSVAFLRLLFASSNCSANSNAFLLAASAAALSRAAGLCITGWMNKYSIPLNRATINLNGNAITENIPAHILSRACVRSNAKTKSTHNNSTTIHASCFTQPRNAITA